MIRLRSRLLSAVCVSALLSAAASAAPPPAPKARRAHSAPLPAGQVAQPTPAPTPPPTPSPVTLDSGSDWLVVDVPAGTSLADPQGTSTEPELTSEGGPATPVTLESDSDQHVYILHGDAGVTESPLPDTIKTDLLPSQDDSGGISISIEDGGDSVYMVSQEIAEGIEASETAGELTPEIAAIAEPLDDGSVSYSSSIATNSIFGNCATQEKTVNKVINLNHPFGNSYNLGQGFTGSYSIDGHLTGTVTAELKFDVKRKKILGVCVPYSAKFKSVHAFGNATSNGGVTVNGTVSYQGSFGPAQIAKPELFNVWFSIGPIPVNIGFNLPISTGLSVSANVTGTVNYNGTHTATGSFDYVCTLDDCTGSGSFDNSATSGSQTITGGVSGHVKPVPYVDIGFRAYLYTESIAYAQVGVRPYLLGDLWGYTGNACGDADGDGTLESVHALTFDLDRRIDITGEASVFSLSPWQRTLRTGSVAHVGFYDLINSNAMQPQIQGPAALNVNTAGPYKVKIRPCWPYTDKVTYQVNWGDGSAVQALEGVPGTDVQASHTWTAAGSPTVTATSVRDEHGRTLNQGYSRTVQVTVPTPLALTVTPSPGSATYGNAITWTANATGGDPATLKYAFFRRRAGTTPWTPDVTTPAWQTSNVFSWTPAAADAGTWETYVWVKDANTPANLNTYGYAAGYNPGPVQVVAPLTVTGTASPASSTYGNAITWTANASGGTPATLQYAIVRQLVGTTTWIPATLVWQTSNVISWTPAAGDVGTWQFFILVKDGNTPANPGYTAFYNPGQVQVVAPLTLTSTGSPASASSGTTLTWTASASGGTPATLRYAFFRRRAGTTPWTPDITAPVWQTSNVLSWTPTAADAGTWEIILWVKDGNTPANANTYGYAAYYNAGPVQVFVPLTLTGTGSPGSSQYGNTITWTASASGGTPATTKYAFFRRRAGTTPWTPDVNAPAWQTSNVFSWTPTSADVGTWETYIWVKDANTPAGMNTYSYGAGYNPGPVQITAPPAPLTLTVTASPGSSQYGNTITWTASASGGTPATTKYAFFRRRAGTTPWTPDVTAPVWQSSNVFSWTPTSADIDTWEIILWVKDGNTPANANTYGYAAYYNAGPVQVTGVLQAYPAKGWVDGYNSQHIWGWACDPDYPTQNNRVDVWSTSGQNLGSAGAYLSSSAAINSACLGGTAHYFDFYPSGGIASGTHFNVWSIDLPYSTPGNDNRKAGGTGAIGDGTEFVIP
jgi:hypothetical protein